MTPRVFPEWEVAFRGGPRDGDREVVSSDLRVLLHQEGQRVTGFYERTSAKHLTWTESLTVWRNGPVRTAPCAAGSMFWGGGHL